MARSCNFDPKEVVFHVTLLIAKSERKVPP